MTVRLARIDDRLIHGQVIHGWLPRLSVDLVVVADRELADSEDQQQIACLAVPDGVEVQFVAPDQVADAVADERMAIVLFRTPVEACEALDAGFRPACLNLGNLHFEPGKIQLRKTFCCSNRELDALKRIAGMGIALEYQPAPDLKRLSLTPDDLPGQS